jgi:HD-GYP domain-containing protein (c-di-GMP phosphodiesterase class II)
MGALKRGLERLVERVGYARQSAVKLGRLNAGAARRSPRAGALERIDRLMAPLEEAFLEIERGERRGVERIEALGRELIRIFDAERNGAIAAAHLASSGDYSLSHPVDCAIISCLLARYGTCEEQVVERIVFAALTQNIGMRSIQDRMQLQSDRLSARQLAALRAHPELGAGQLQRAGVRDRGWIETVRQHHERCDGRGYPLGLFAAEIRPEARVLALADRYTAMVSARSYRSAMSVAEARRACLAASGRAVDGPMARRLFALLGPAPPGSIVCLECGSRGVVVGQGARGVTRIAVFAPADGGVRSAKDFERGEHRMRDAGSLKFAASSREEGLAIRAHWSSLA